MDKPDIVEIISHHVLLRRAGRELAGLCPFHADKNPSFFVNADKQVFLCRACGAKGDVFDFVSQIECLPIRDVLARYRFERRYVPRDNRVKRASGAIAAWAQEASERLAEALRQVGHELSLAKELNMREEIEGLERAWMVLETFDEDLFSEHVLQLYQNRDALAAIIHESV